MYTYLWCFFIFAFLGWCGEVAFAALRDKRFVNRGFLNGPLCPIYGFGVALIDFVMAPFGGNLALLIIGSMILGSGLEWFAGFVLEKLFRQKWWDYSDQPHNLNGYICLKFSIVWGVGGALIVRFLFPVMRQIIALIPHTLGMILLAGMLGLILMDFVVTVIAIIGLNRKLKNLEYVSGKIRAGSDKLGKGISEGTLAVKEWEKEAARLKDKYEEYLKTSRFHQRLLKAFPRLTSIKHNEQLEDLRQNLDLFRRRSSELIKKHNEAAIAVYEEKYPDGAARPFASGMCFSKLFWIFMIGNFVGFVLETIYALLMPPHQFELRVSVVFGPFILIYGLGAVAITLCLYKMYNQKDVLIFIASMFIGGGFEYLCSFAQQMMFGTVSWEYSESALNIGGRTNLMYSFFWGILGLIWVKDLYPIISRAIEKIPKKVGKPLTIVVAIFMIFDMAISAGAVARQSQRVNNVPATNIVQEFFDEYFTDDFLKIIYPHMQYVGKPELPKEITEGENNVS